ncbi:MAG: hypothetical protein ACYS8W_02700 [Planctomycetota bacterium]
MLEEERSDIIIDEFPGEPRLYIKAPARPFPWWGEFNLPDAVGRAFLIAALACISFSAIGIMSRTRIYNAAALSLIAVPFLFAFGLSFIYRSWVSTLIIGILLVLMGAFVTLSVFRYAYYSIDAMAVPEKYMQYRRSIEGDPIFGFVYRESVLNLIPRIAVYIFLFFGMVAPLWRCWNRNHVYYYFSHVRADTLENGLFDTVAMYGSAMILLGAAAFLSGIIISFGGVDWGMIYRRDITVFHFEYAAIFLSVLICAVIAAFWKLRLSIIVCGLFAVFGFSIAVLAGWGYIILPIWASPHGWTRWEIWDGFSFVILGLITLVPAFIILLGAIAFRKGLNYGRLWLHAGIVTAIITIALWAFRIPIVYFSRELLVPGNKFEIYDFGFVLYSLFKFAVPGYILLEMIRFLRSAKALAWCGVGEYVPPWERQLDEIILEREYEMEEEALECLERVEIDPE